jgi:hypothetical protein
LYDMRAQGYSWDRACRAVYHDDTFTASVIARYLDMGSNVLYKNVVRHDKRAWPPVTIT